jgi:putative spermidine/putrescine transport system ATP-binding protein
MNFVPAKAIGEDGALTVLRLSNDAIVKAVGAAPVVTGTNCLIAIRPERLQVEAGQNFENSVEATVSDVIFQGNNLLVQASLADGTQLAAEVRRDQPVEITRGQRMRMGWGNRDGRCFAA